MVRRGDLNQYEEAVRKNGRWYQQVGCDWNFWKVHLIAEAFEVEDGAEAGGERVGATTRKELRKELGATRKELRRKRGKGGVVREALQGGG